MAAAELTIDHVTIAGKNLEAMRAALQAQGISTELGGTHNNHATEMALTSFTDGSYLELIAIQPNADLAAVSAHPWSKALQTDGGPCAFAVRATDLGKEVARLKLVGFPVSQPERAGRTRPDGVKIEWETADIQAGPRGSFFPFLIRDFTPRENRAFPSGKPTTDKYRGIGKVIVGVRDLDDAIARYRHAYGLPAPRSTRSIDLAATLAYFDGTPIVLASNATWIASRVRDYGEAPCAFILSRAKPGNHLTWLDAASLGWRLGVQ